MSRIIKRHFADTLLSFAKTFFLTYLENIIVLADKSAVKTKLTRDETRTTRGHSKHNDSM